MDSSTGRRQMWRWKSKGNLFQLLLSSQWNRKQGKSALKRSGVGSLKTGEHVTQSSRILLLKAQSSDQQQLYHQVACQKSQDPTGVQFRRGTCTPMFIAVLSIVAKVWKEPKCPSMDEWIQKTWYTHIQWSTTQQSKRMKSCHLQLRGCNWRVLC